MKPLFIAALLLTGCGARRRSPEGAVHALSDAVAAGNREAAYQLLGPATRARLAAAARRLGELSGRRQVSPIEVLAVGWSPPRYTPLEVREVERMHDRATVEVTGAHGERDRVDCVHEPDGWKIELPPP